MEIRPSNWLSWLDAISDTSKVLQCLNTYGFHNQFQNMKRKIKFHATLTGKTNHIFKTSDSLTCSNLLIPTNPIWVSPEVQGLRSTCLYNLAFMPVWCYNLNCLLYTSNESPPPSTDAPILSSIILISSVWKLDLYSSSAASTYLARMSFHWRCPYLSAHLLRTMNLCI